MSEIVGGSSQLGWVAVKAVLMLTVAIAGLRLAERRTLAELGPFDFAVAVAVGAIIGRTATSSTTSFATGAVALVTLLVAHRLVAAAHRRGWAADLLERPPSVLIADGRVREAALARAGLTTAEMYAMLRQNHISDVSDVQYLLYETRGAVSVLRTGEQIGAALAKGIAASGYQPDSPTRVS